MKMSVVKVPFGPEVTLFEHEFFAVTRHRIMLFFYFGLVCMILVSSMGQRGPLAEPELVLGVAAIEVLVGLVVMIACKLFIKWQAQRRKTVPRVHLGWVLVATVTASVSSAEVLNPLMFGVAPSSPLEFVMKVAFYLTVTELLTSIMMQYTLSYILDDLRRDKTTDEDAARGAVLPGPLT